MALAEYWICAKCDARNHPSFQRCTRPGCGYARDSQEREDEFPACQEEAQLHYDIISECKARGWLYFHGSMAHKTKRTTGEPDFVILCDNGNVLFVECKAENRKRSDKQLQVAAHARRLGHTVHVVRSIDQFKVLANEAVWRMRKD